MKKLLAAIAITASTLSATAEETPESPKEALTDYYICAMYDMGDAGGGNRLYYVYKYALDQDCLEYYDDYYVGNLQYPFMGDCEDCYIGSGIVASNPKPLPPSPDPSEWANLRRRPLQESEANDPFDAPIYNEFRGRGKYNNWALQRLNTNRDRYRRIQVTIGDDTINAYLYCVRTRGAAETNRPRYKVTRRGRYIVSNTLWIAYETDDDFTGLEIFNGGDDWKFVGTDIRPPAGYRWPDQPFLTNVYRNDERPQDSFLLRRMVR